MSPGSAARSSVNVFINCPFDPDYAELFPALVFTVQACGFHARCALEESDASETRIEKLYRIIAECGHGIHDISRTELGRNRLPRFNMPLELGIFLGARKYGGSRQRQKRCLILDRHPYRYQKFCSDLAGHDPRAHSNRPKKAVIVVRDWLRDSRKGGNLPGGEAIFERYRAFKDDLPLLCAISELNGKSLRFNDLVMLVDRWLGTKPF